MQTEPMTSTAQALLEPLLPARPWLLLLLSHLSGPHLPPSSPGRSQAPRYLPRDLTASQDLGDEAEGVAVAERRGAGQTACDSGVLSSPLPSAPQGSHSLVSLLPHGRVHFLCKLFPFLSSVLALPTSSFPLLSSPFFSPSPHFPLLLLPSSSLLPILPPFSLLIGT